MASKKNLVSAGDAARLLGTTPRKAIGRLVALGYTVTCSRCGGSGRHSWNRIDGDRCFGCGGQGKNLAPLTAAIVDQAIARIAAGELSVYFARNAARQTIRGKIEKFRAAYQGARVSRVYTAISCSGLPACAVVTSPEFRAMGLLNAVHDWVGRVEDGRRATPDLDPIGTCAQIDQAIVLVAQIDQAWTTFSEVRTGDAPASLGDLASRGPEAA